ncbi:hypothetical protein PV08_07011 [Exophiala spinifera]|uniref:Up-regulated during septation protein 1 domain-containing protein n=1 Tax=Exophiala spinifera TaxID=91928 RepID=A0A0D2BSI9_9EURO|nr:uncharacterized protein PV08_07011 [Exophiala spinifera]KIW14229.1 hypothetical protein PV08_07011 [Exophiala spinifera]
MQAYAFGLRQSAADSLDDGQSRYVPSSVYSGPGPIDDSPAIGNNGSFMSGALRGPFADEQPTPRFAPPPVPKQPRNSTLLNINDPVAMHLLAETAMSDSRDFEVLSFEEVDQLKRERVYLRGKVDTTRRKLALETKLRDAAQSLNRLYSVGDKQDSGGGSSRSKRRSLLANQQTSGAEMASQADDEYAASNKKVEELTRELSLQEKELERVQMRILQHTAGILQMTHKGLKKNVRQSELPRSPESMTSQPNGRISGVTGIDDFDERSLYQVPDYVTDFGTPSIGLGVRGKQGSKDPIEDVAARLQEVNGRLHMMVNQSGTQAHFDPPPQPTDVDMVGRVGAQIQAHLGYLSQGLDAMEAVQARSKGLGQDSALNHEGQLEDVNIRLHDLLERTNSVSHSPNIPQDEPRGKDLQSQLALSSSILNRLNSRVQTLVEQKDILTRQIQQQRELNTKSDAQRDSKIHELTDEIELHKRALVAHEEESRRFQEQINLLSEQLDMAKQEGMLLEQQRGATDKQADDATAPLLERISGLETAKAAAETDLAKARDEINGLEADVVRAQTELTMVKAELDGAYGTRAQRAADVSMNPAIQKEIDDLNARNEELEKQLDFLKGQHETKGAGSAELQNKVNTLQQELKETLEEYEIMTKQSIEDEKERERLEEQLDTFQQRCETLESQLNEERVKWLGAKTGLPTESTSTMVLKNEFKKMMRETRAENLKTIKASSHHLLPNMKSTSNLLLG